MELSSQPTSPLAPPLVDDDAESEDNEDEDIENDGIISVCDTPKDNGNNKPFEHFTIDRLAKYLFKTYPKTTLKVKVA